MRHIRFISLIATCLCIAASGLVALPAIAGSTEADVEAVTKEFQTYCAPCHGREGRGDGAVGAGLDARPADLTQITKHNGGTFPFEAVYAKVEGIDNMKAHRSSEMPVWGFWFVTQEVGDSTSLADAKPAEDRARRRILAIVTFLKTIQEK